jgi:hypothetical protein
MIGLNLEQSIGTANPSTSSGRTDDLICVSLMDFLGSISFGPLTTNLRVVEYEPTGRQIMPPAIPAYILDEHPKNLPWCICPAIQGASQILPSIESGHHKTTASLYTLKVSLLARFRVSTLL